MSSTQPREDLVRSVRTAAILEEVQKSFLASTEAMRDAINELRQDLRDSNEQHRQDYNAVETRLRHLEISLARHRVRARVLTAACGVGASAATHLVSRFLVIPLPIIK
jgi:hypothetical protein